MVELNELLFGVDFTPVNFTALCSLQHWTELVLGFRVNPNPKIARTQMLSLEFKQVVYLGLDETLCDV